jgi:hypothetical protein
MASLRPMHPTASCEDFEPRILLSAYHCQLATSSQQIVSILAPQRRKSHCLMFYAILLEGSENVGPSSGASSSPTDGSWRRRLFQSDSGSRQIKSMSFDLAASDRRCDTTHCWLPDTCPIALSRHAMNLVNQQCREMLSLRTVLACLITRICCDPWDREFTGCYRFTTREADPTLRTMHVRR